MGDCDKETVEEHFADTEENVEENSTDTEENMEEKFVDTDMLLAKVDSIITERKKLMTELEEQENELRTIIEEIKKQSSQHSISSENVDISKTLRPVQVEVKFKPEQITKEKYGASVQITEGIDESEKAAPKSQQEKSKKTAPETKQKKEKKHGWIGDLIFYVLLFGMVIGALALKGIDNDAPKSIAGISIFSVLTGSMENEIPKGSLVVTKHLEPSELKIGDDITFMANETTTITHRIVGIIDNYEQTGQRAFVTKGTMNKDKDKLPVPAVNVIGKVIYHNYTLGKIRDFISQNIIIILVMLVLIWALFYVLRSIFKKDTEEMENISEREHKTEKIEIASEKEQETDKIVTVSEQEQK